MQKPFRIAVVIALVFTQVNSSFACMMVPKNYTGRISQSRQRAILIQQGDRQELILQVDYKIAGENMPDQFAWIITTPSEPSAYHVSSRTTIRAMGTWAERMLRKTVPPPAARSKTRKEPADSSGLVFGQPAKVGPYDIQPVRALGVEALTALNEWLAQHGFPTEDPDHMKYFVENGFTFCCVRVSPDNQVKVLAPKGGLPPLHLSFRSKSLYYPLKFSSRQGVFNVDLTTLTDKPLDLQRSSAALKRLNWSSAELKQNVTVADAKLPVFVKSILEKSDLKGSVPVWYVNKLKCRNVNRGDSIATWKEDVFLHTSINVATNDRRALWLPIGLIAGICLGLGKLSCRRRS